LPDRRTPRRSFPRAAAVPLALVGPYTDTALDGDACPWMGPRRILFVPAEERAELIGRSRAMMVGGDATEDYTCLRLQNETKHADSQPEITR
jgi:hypothetical protein